MTPKLLLYKLIDLYFNICQDLQAPGVLCRLTIQPVMYGTFIEEIDAMNNTNDILIIDL